MAKLFLLFSHQLTDEQQQDAQKNWQITEFVVMPDELKQRFRNVPADLENLSNYTKPFCEWVEKNASPSDIILVQGDFGLTYKIVNWCKEHYLTTVYSTTQRVIVKEDPTTGRKESIFKHIRFREF